MIKKVICLYKQIGVTPLQAIDNFRINYPRYKKSKLGYAGRLDPMAEGLLLVLVGDENKKRDKYLQLDKEHEFKVLLGISTDSYDILGLITSADQQPKVSTYKLRKALRSFSGEYYQTYPPYSSQTVKGKRLYKWAREGRLDEIELPRKKITIIKLKLKEVIDITRDSLEPLIYKRISMANGDFRQPEILKSWKSFFNKTVVKKWQVLKLHIACSSGTYVRSIAHELGEKLEIGATALSIKRTKIGNFTIADCQDNLSNPGGW